MPTKFIHPQDYLDAINRQPLNQEAKRWLKVAGAEIDSTGGPYLFQLMLWALDKGKVDLLPEYKSQVRSAVEQLTFLLDPQKAMDYLLQREDDPESPRLEVSDLQNQRSPKEVARLLFDTLDQRMSADNNLQGVYPPIYPFNPG